MNLNELKKRVLIVLTLTLLGLFVATILKPNDVVEAQGDYYGHGCSLTSTDPTKSVDLPSPSCLGCAPGNSEKAVNACKRGGEINYTLYFDSTGVYDNTLAGGAE